MVLSAACDSKNVFLSFLPVVQVKHTVLDTSGNSFHETNTLGFYTTPRDNEGLDGRWSVCIHEMHILKNQQIEIIETHCSSYGNSGAPASEAPCGCHMGT